MLPLPRPSDSKIDDTLSALGHVLSGARQRARVGALALADTQGFLIAGAGHFRTCEELSAFAPLATEVLAAEIELGSERVLLCASSPLPDRDLVRGLVEECRRILGPRTPQLV